MDRIRSKRYDKDKNPFKKNLTLQALQERAERTQRREHSNVKDLEIVYHYR